MKIFARFVMYSEYGGSLELWDAIDEYSMDENSDLALKDPPEASSYVLGFKDITIEVDDNLIRERFTPPVIQGKISKNN